MITFNLTCGVCQRAEGVHVLCHHCGKPLCREHAISRADDAFQGKAVAFHCLDCLLRDHVRLASLPYFKGAIRALWLHVPPFRALLNRGHGYYPGPAEPETDDEAVA